MKKSLPTSFAIAAIAIVGAVGAVSNPAHADVAKGEKVFKKCKACHTMEEGGKNRIGPNLFGIVGKPAAANADFSYSDALTAAAADGLVWTEENLDLFIKKPRKFLKKTKMSFAGVKKDEQRANLIEYMATFK